MNDVRKQARLCHWIMNIKNELYTTVEMTYTLRVTIDATHIFGRN